MNYRVQIAEIPAGEILLGQTLLFRDGVGRLRAEQVLRLDPVQLVDGDQGVMVWLTNNFRPRAALFALFTVVI